MTEFGWSHGAISTAASINLLVFGLSAPFAAALTERVRAHAGRRRRAGADRAQRGRDDAGRRSCGSSTSCGASSPARRPAPSRPCWPRPSPGRWFVARRGLVVGLLTARTRPGSSSSCRSWRTSPSTPTGAGRWPSSAAPRSSRSSASLALLRDRPSDLGLAPYGGEAEAAAGARAASPRRTSCARSAATRCFLALAGSFFICGATTVGLIAVHLIPAAHDHGIPAGQAAGLMAAMGVLDIAGTTGSGWLTDRYPAPAPAARLLRRRAGSRC